jgi:hypothetical protein
VTARLLLVDAVRDPLASYSGPEWERILTEALTGALLGVIEERVKGEAARLPKAVREQLEGVAAVADYNRRLLSWEVNRIALALKDVKGPVVLLKGAAYHMRGLEGVKGRLASDVDILVPKDQIAETEAALRLAGWVPLQYGAYNEHYYREWMHEIPPLQNVERGTYIDVHHTILPETGRLRPDTERLFANAEALPGTGLHTLSPADMVLHTIVHCFQDGDLNSRLRDLYDIHGLLTDFGREPGFWDKLFEASDAHGFSRPLFYGLYFAERLFGTVLPPEVRARARRHAPVMPVMAAMRFMVPRALMPPRLEGLPVSFHVSRFCLFLRSHWLKMPPLMLMRHLFTKFLMRRTGRA